MVFMRARLGFGGLAIAEHQTGPAHFHGLVVIEDHDR
jgi:hypothetical protein